MAKVLVAGWWHCLQHPELTISLGPIKQKAQVCPSPRKTGVFKLSFPSNLLSSSRCNFRFKRAPKNRELVFISMKSLEVASL